jgi:hypothetical protein
LKTEERGLELELELERAKRKEGQCILFCVEIQKYFSKKRKKNVGGRISALLGTLSIC